MLCQHQQKMLRELPEYKAERLPAAMGIAMARPSGGKLYTPSIRVCVTPHGYTVLCLLLNEHATSPLHYND